MSGIAWLQGRATARSEPPGAFACLGVVPSEEEGQMAILVHRKVERLAGDRAMARSRALANVQ
jgi:hypothetical protein